MKEDGTVKKTKILSNEKELSEIRCTFMNHNIYFYEKQNKGSQPE